MAYRQQPTPSTDSGPNTTAPVSMQSSFDDESSQMEWKVDPMDRPDEINEEPDADGDILPPNLTFVRSLMRSNEAYMARVERLLGKQEQLVNELNAKELAILKLKTGLEREKELRGKLEWRLERATAMNDVEEEKGMQSQLEHGAPRHQETQASVGDDDYERDVQLANELIREQNDANLIGIKNGNAIIPEDEHLESASIAVQDDEYFREYVPEATMTYTDDVMPFRKKRKAETMTMELYNLQTTIAQHFPSYAFRPLIRSLDDQSAEYGHLEDLHPAVHKSLQTSLQTFHARIQRPQYANHARTPVSTLVCCGYLWMTGCTSSRAWTVHSAGKYTCKTCFNSRRACFLRSHGEWVVLPLPPAVRDAGVTYRDKEYYIYGEGGVTAKSFPDVWEEGMKAAKARERREVQAASEAGWSEVEEVPGWMVY